MVNGAIYHDRRYRTGSGANHAFDPIVRKNGAKLTNYTVRYRRPPCLGVADAPQSRRMQQLAVHARLTLEKT